MLISTPLIYVFLFAAPAAAGGVDIHLLRAPSWRDCIAEALVASARHDVNAIECIPMTRDQAAHLTDALHRAERAQRAGHAGRP